MTRQLAALRDEERQLLLAHSRAKAAYLAEKYTGQSALVESSLFSPSKDREKILLESASRVQYMIANNMAPSYRVDRSGRVLAANRACAALLGYKIEQFYDGSLREEMLVPKQFAKLEKSCLADFARVIVTRAIVTERIAGDGRHIPVAVNFRLMKADASQWNVFLMDLSETKALEEQLWERQTLFATLVSEMPNQVFLVDEFGRTWHFNRRFYELTGLNAADEDGLFATQAMHPDDLVNNSARWNEAFQKHKALIGEVRIRGRNDQYYWHVFRAIPLTAPLPGQLEGLLQLAAAISPQVNAMPYDQSNSGRKFWIGTSTDIDSRKRVIDDVLESACNFQSLADQIPQILWTAGADGRIDFFNNRWFEFSGLRRDIGMGLDFALFIHKDDRRNYVNAWKNCVKTGDALDVQFRLKKQGAGPNDFEDQDYETFLARAVAVRNQRGDIEQWVGTWTSI
ncbi:MAG: PAS domain S-box protein [Cyanobacteria bacterium REEB67]|nr:PAS domain S-box protein [Cyanobacteria bacterium REEB67]